MGQLPDLLTVAETASMLGVTDETIHRWCRLGKLAYIELPSGTKRVSRAVVEAFLVPVVATRRRPTPAQIK